MRRTQPPRVTYRTAPYGDSPELGIRHDRAYWVSEIVSSFSDPGERDYADVDIKTYGCGGSERTFAEDLPGAGPDPVPWESQSFSVSGSTPIAQQNRIEATLANVSSFAVDGTIAGACIDPETPLDYHVTPTDPSTITFSGYSLLDLRPRRGHPRGHAACPSPGPRLGLGRRHRAARGARATVRRRRARR